ncbi:hypothetical protein ACFVZZ_14590 [Streptomyces chartreusis]
MHVTLDAVRTTQGAVLCEECGAVSLLGLLVLGLGGRPMPPGARGGTC